MSSKHEWSLIPVLINFSISPQTMLRLLLHPSARKLAQRFGPPQMRATPPPSPSTITTLLATCRSTQSHFLQSLSMPPHSVSGLPTHMDSLYQYLPLVAGQHPAMPSMTALHTGWYPMATALPLYMPVAHAQPVLSMLSPSHVNLYYRSLHMRNLCEHSELRHGEKLKWRTGCVLGPYRVDLKRTVRWTVLSRVY